MLESAFVMGAMVLAMILANPFLSSHSAEAKYKPVLNGTHVEESNVDSSMNKSKSDLNSYSNQETDQEEDEEDEEDEDEIEEEEEIS